MKPIEVKIFLLKNGLTVAEMARQLCVGTDTKFDSMRTMIDDTLYGKRFYPSVAAKLESKFGLKIERPAHLKSRREVMKQVA